MKNYIAICILAMLSITSIQAQKANKAQIIGGQEIDIKSRPFQAALYYLEPQDGKWYLFASGSIYNQRSIVSGLIFWRENVVNSDVKVVVGITDLPSPVNDMMQFEAQGQVFNVEHVERAFPFYGPYLRSNPITRSDFNQDIAIFELDADIQFNHKVQPIRLLPPSLDSLTNPGNPAYLSGYGFDVSDNYEFTNYSENLKGIELSFINHSEIYQDVRWASTGNLLRYDTLGVLATTNNGLGDDGPGAFDHGAPLTVTDGKGNQYLAGTVAIGDKYAEIPINADPLIDDAAESLGLYVKISDQSIQYIPWWSCLDSVNVDDSIYVNAQFDAITKLKASSPFASNKIVDLSAGEEVELLPGFSYDAGTNGVLTVDTGGACNMENIGTTNIPWPYYPEFKQELVSIEEVENSANTALRLSPNPAKDEVTISFANDEVLNTLEVYDMNGKQVYAEDNIQQNSPVLISLTGMTPGIYFVRALDNAGNNYSEKLSIVK